MIISASRRTDIPAFYVEWFFNQLKDGYVLVQHPRNPQMFSKVLLNTDVVDCFVFWSKNPSPMLTRLDELKDYTYYFQFTLTPYGSEIEPHLPSVKRRIEIFKRLSDKVGKNRVVWRYDPIFVNNQYPINFHVDTFAEIAYALKDHTERCTMSFIDCYAHVQRTFDAFGIQPLNSEDMISIAKSLSETATEYNIRLETCAENLDLSADNIFHGACIDKMLIERIIGSPLVVKKDKNQRPTCNCIESIDIGMYNTCSHGCIYCYATTGNDKLLHNVKLHDVNSPKLVGCLNETDIITGREMKRLRTDQQTLF